MAYSFSGGISIKTENKTKGLAAKPFAEPPQVAIPLFGCTPLVSVGDYVDIGACIGFSTEAGLCPAHASVSGVVTAIEKRALPDGKESTFVIIKNDCRHTVVSTLDPVTKPLDKLSVEELIARVRNAGIVDSASGKSVAAMLKDALGKAKRIVINFAESGPWQSSAYRLMSEQTDAVIKGIKLLIYILGVRKADIAVSENNEGLIEKIEEHITDKSLIDIRLTTAKHPIGMADRLIFAMYGKRVPLGGQPHDIGYAVFTPETAANVYRALSTGMPMIHKRVTVSGDCIKTPRDLIVPIGTSVLDIAAFCGGTKKRFKHLVKGGALTGTAAGEDAVVDKTCDTLLFLSASKVKSSNCIRCGHCIDTCPVGLTPALLAAYSEKGLYGNCAELGIAYCIGCGCCAYVCPSGVPIVSLIKKAKTALNDEKRKEDE